ncbi:hypothetical protein IscW_ISCW018525, partial [Ixodes scapularis]
PKHRFLKRDTKRGETEAGGLNETQSQNVGYIRAEQKHIASVPESSESNPSYVRPREPAWPCQIGRRKRLEPPRHGRRPPIQRRNIRKASEEKTSPTLLIYTVRVPPRPMQRKQNARSLTQGKQRKTKLETNWRKQRRRTGTPREMDH